MPKQSTSTWTIDDLRFSYDSEADILYVRVSEGKFSHNLDVSDGVVADIGADGQVLGFEIVAVSSIMPASDTLIPEDCHIPWYLLSKISRSSSFVPA